MPLELQPVVDGGAEPVGPVEQGEHAEGEQDDAGEMSSAASSPRAPNSAHRNGSMLIERFAIARPKLVT